MANEQVALNQQIIRLRDTDGFRLASDLIGSGQGRMVMDHARSLTDLMEAEENRMLQARAAKQKRDQRLASLVILVGAALAFILSLLINRSIRTDVIEREHQREMIERQTRQLQKQAATLEQALAKARKAEAEQSRLARQMTALLESTEAGFYGMDADGICTFVNRAGARMLGFEVEELIGKEMHSMVHHHHADGRPYPLEECPIYNACRKGTVTSADNEVFWRKDGTPVAVEYSTSPMVEESDLKGRVVAYSDVTERLRASAIQQ